MGVICLLPVFEVPPCFVTALMKSGIQRHRVEVQGRIFASETMVSGSVTATPTHPRNNLSIALVVGCSPRLETGSVSRSSPIKKQVLL